MTRTPPKPPIVHRLEVRRAGRPDRGGLDLMFWACVVVAVAGLYALLTWGAIR